MLSQSHYDKAGVCRDARSSLHVTPARGVGAKMMRFELDAAHRITPLTGALRQRPCLGSPLPPCAPRSRSAARALAPLAPLPVTLSLILSLTVTVTHCHSAASSIGLHARKKQREGSGASSCVGLRANARPQGTPTTPHPSADGPSGLSSLGLAAS